MASITFTDASGTATFDNAMATLAGGVASRFANWVPFQRPVGAVATSLGTGARAMFRFRTDYGASFQVPEIPLGNMATALRLQAHLLDGGTVIVRTDDAAGRTYTTCCLAPDGDVTLELADRQTLTYTMGLSLINLGGTPMLCDYGTGMATRSARFAWQAANGVVGGTFTRTDAARFYSRA